MIADYFQVTADQLGVKPDHFQVTAVRNSADHSRFPYLSRLSIYKKQGNPKERPGAAREPEVRPICDHEAATRLGGPGHHWYSKLTGSAFSPVKMAFFQGSSHISASHSHFNAAGRDQYNLHILTSKAEDDDALASLQPAKSPYVQPCMYGTRQWMIDRVADWLVDPHAPNILLLTGSPGAGKSTVASTLVSNVQEAGRLGSGFFCKRDDVVLGDPATCWRTIASNLARCDPIIAKRMAENIRGRRVDPGRADIELHFKYLIEDPLREAWRRRVETLAEMHFDTENEWDRESANDGRLIAGLPVVVLDALDECGSDGSQSAQRQTFINTLTKWARLPRSLKLVVTSRDHKIPKSFRDVCRCIVLTTGHVAEPEAINDVGVFLRTRFATIAENSLLPPNWPGEFIIEHLIRRAAGLFVWADTLVKFVEQGIPNMRLQSILQGQNEHERLDELYRQVMSLSFENATANELEIYRRVVGAVVLAKIPLRKHDLRHFMGREEEEGSITYIIRSLSSVISMGAEDEPIHISHLSFTEFICDPRRCGERFVIHRGVHERIMTLACLQIMRLGLRFNICQLESSYVRNVDVRDLASRINKFIPTHLSYSCCLWADHLQNTIVDVTLIKMVNEFMHTDLLHWLEVLSLIREVGIGPQILLLLQKWVEVGATRSQIL